jgi:3-isopropylmalate/(R)-2-methylmalate dehydratase small subunit
MYLEDNQMKTFKKHTGIVCPIDLVNIDTDAIIPKQFLKRIDRTGFGEFLFYEFRYTKEGDLIDTFSLNKKEYKNSSILLSRSNFGCGSSREHAPWAIEDYGFKSIIASSFADIFYNNCFNNGILPVVLPDKTIDKLFDNVNSKSGYKLTVDLLENVVYDDFNFKVNFNIESHLKEKILNGYDDISLTLKFEDKILAYEKSHKII